MSPLVGAIVAAVAAVVGGGTGAAGVAALSRRRLTRSEADHQDAQTVGKWIENGRAQAEQIGRLQQAQLEAFARIEKLEERERQQLARVAAHSVWDDALIRFVAQSGLDLPEGLLPPPPPLTGNQED